MSRADAWPAPTEARRRVRVPALLREFFHASGLAVLFAAAAFAGSPILREKLPDDARWAGAVIVWWSVSLLLGTWFVLRSARLRLARPGRVRRVVIALALPPIGSLVTGTVAFLLLALPASWLVAIWLVTNGTAGWLPAYVVMGHVCTFVMLLPFLVLFESILFSVPAGFAAMLWIDRIAPAVDGTET